MSSQTSIASTSRMPGEGSEVCEVNDSLVELHRPSGVPTVQVLFFHGLPVSNDPDVHLSTWECGDGSSHLWPKTWLVEEFPGAHVFSVRYSQGLLHKASVKTFDMKIIRENLLSDLIEGNIGQVRGCPVVLVGHCIGGLVIKQLCMEAHRTLGLSQNSLQKSQLQKFLNRINGIVYYATPHHGILHIARAKDLVQSPLFKYFETLSTVAERQNSDFNLLSKIYSRWQIRGLGESLPAQSGVFRGIIVVPEASARDGVLNVDTADHFSISKPPSKTSRRFNVLAQLLHNTMSDSKENTRPANFQHIGHQLKGMHVPVEEVKRRLKDAQCLCLIGMGGLGKTTLAKEIFNDMAWQFEYTCFVPDVKLTGGSEEKFMNEVWECLYHDGQKVGGESNWSKLRGKDILLVLDDISTDRDVNVLSRIAEGCSSKSCYIATSRQQDILDDTYEVPLLHEDYSQQLFMSFAFPKEVSPPAVLASVVQEIVRKCEGLPLTLEVLGRWLKRTQKMEDWMQALHALRDAEAVTGLNEKLWKKLRISYDGLQDKEKQIFLDATTFFTPGVDGVDDLAHRWTLHEAKLAWKEAYQLSSENLLWQTLVDRSLVYDVHEHEPIKIHEQLRSLGQKIASESKDQCRLWLTLKEWHLLPSTHESKNHDIHALQLIGNVGVSGNRELHSTHLKNLRYLQVEDGLRFPMTTVLRWGIQLFYPELISSVVQDQWVPSNLVILECVGILLLDPTRQRRLVILRLHGVRANSLPKSIGQLSRLRFLYLDGRELRSLPDEIGLLSLLEDLDLRCWQLQTLPKTFGQLSNLKKLALSGCDSLSSLPESFGELSALEHLTLECCYSLRTLPESFGQLESLSQLSMILCPALCSLPDSFGALRALFTLTVFFCDELKAVPDSFGQLRSLRLLALDPFGLPESIEYIYTLRDLTVLHCTSVHSLPKPLGRLRDRQRL